MIVHPRDIAMGHRRTPRWARLALLAALAYVLGVELWGVVQVLGQREALAAMAPAGHGVRLFLAPFIAVASVLAGWLLYFRREREGARVWAFAGGALLLVIAFVVAVGGALADAPTPRLYTWGYPLCALALFAYGSKAMERRG